MNACHIVSRHNMSFFRILRPSTRFVVCPQCRTFAAKTVTDSPDIKDSPNPKKATKDPSSTSMFSFEDEFCCTVLNRTS